MRDPDLTRAAPPAPSPRSARTRVALRAAQVVCGLSLAACGATTTPSSDGGGALDARAIDASIPDAGAIADAGFTGDANCTELIPTNQYCCEADGGTWWVYDGGFAECFIAVPGPFVPPAERA